MTAPKGSRIPTSITDFIHDSLLIFDYFDWRMWYPSESQEFLELRRQSLLQAFLLMHSKFAGALCSRLFANLHVTNPCLFAIRFPGSLPLQDLANLATGVCRVDVHTTMDTLPLIREQIGVSITLANRGPYTGCASLQYQTLGFLQVTEASLAQDSHFFDD